MDCALITGGFAIAACLYTIIRDIIVSDTLRQKDSVALDGLRLLSELALFLGCTVVALSGGVVNGLVAFVAAGIWKHIIKIVYEYIKKEAKA